MLPPWLTRFDTYAIAVAADTRTYMDTLLATPAFQKWKSAALKETWEFFHHEVD